jgi:DNA-binding phage protein
MTKEKLKFLNIKRFNSEAILPSAESLPTLISEKAYKAITENENTPYMLTEAIDFPVEGDGGIYTREFFESYLEHLKDYPFGGSKRGHFSEDNDFFTIGGSIDLKNEKEGTAFFKILIPQMDSNGNPTGNAAFIRDCKAGYVNFSLTTYPKYEDVKNNDGATIRYIIASEGGERNDSVGYDNGYMPQNINNKNKENELLDLIKGGNYFLDRTDSEDIIQNGKVSKYALVKILNAGKADIFVKNALSAIDKKENLKKKSGGNKMDKEELLKTLKAAIANNQLTLEEIAQAVGLENKVRTNDDADRDKLLKAIKEELGLAEDISAEEVLAKVTEILKEVKEAEETTAEAAANEIAGRKTFKNAKGEDEIDPCFLYAKNALRGKHGKDLESAKNALKADPIMLRLRSTQADIGAGKAATENKTTFREV